MKALYFLLLITFCESTLVGLSPTDVRLTTYGDDKESWFVVNWTKVINSDATDPVLGYKKEPTVEVAEIEVPGDKTEVKYDKMKLNVLYEVAVQAYTAKKVGPLSPKYKFSWV